MRRFIVITLLLVLIVLGAVVGVVYYLASDEAFLKAQVSQAALRLTGRELTVDGPLHLQLGREIRLDAGEIHYANAPWANPRDMVSIGGLHAVVDVISLFSDTVEMPLLAVEDCSVSLSRSEAGEENWAVIPATPPAEQEEPRQGLPVLIADLSLKNCHLGLDAPERKEPLDLTVDSAALLLQAGGRAEGEGAGHLNGDAFSFSGWIAPLSAFRLGGPLELDVKLGLGDVAIAATGTVQDARTGAGANLHAQLSGPEIGQVLDYFSQPPVSKGPFDFRVDLNSEGTTTRVVVDGDLGTLQVDAKGELDALLQPTKGDLRVTVRGPSLQNLGQVFGIEGLVPDEYLLDAGLRFEPGLVDFEKATLTTGQDLLDASGKLGTGAGLPGTDLRIHIESSDLTRWSGLLGREPPPPGSLQLTAALMSDDDGLFSVEADVREGPDTLRLEGPVGHLPGPLEPDLRIEFNSPDASRLGTLYGLQRIPAAPLAVGGRVSLTGRRVTLSGLVLNLAGDRATVDGRINLGKGYAGSKLDLRLDIADAARLGDRFGVSGLPPQPMKLSSVLEPLDGRGLAFRVNDGNLGEIQVDLEGRLADIRQPLAVNADFNVHLPSLAILTFLAPDANLPDVPVSATGQLRNSKDETHLEQVELSVGESTASVGGVITVPDRRFALDVKAGGGDASFLNQWLGADPGHTAWSVSGHLAGTPEAFGLQGLELRLGPSRIDGDLELGTGEPRRLSGKLSSPYLDMSWLVKKEEPPREQQSKPPRYLFDDTPIVVPADYGAVVDLDVAIARLNLGNALFQDLSAGIHLDGRTLALEPVSFSDSSGGKVSGRAVLDNRGPQPHMVLRLEGDGLRLGLASAPDQDPMTIPAVDVDVELNGSGTTEREMASSLNGRLRIFGGKGKILSSGASLLFSSFITELFRTLNPFAEKSPYTTLDCAVFAADAVNGEVRVDPIIINTRELAIFSEGEIDLHSEAIDLSFNTKPRTGVGLSTGILINPFIKVGGRLAHPSIELDPGQAAVSSGLAVATAGISLLAKGLSDRFLSSSDPCGDARKELAKRDAGGGQR